MTGRNSFGTIGGCEQHNRVGCERCDTVERFDRIRATRAYWCCGGSVSVGHTARCDEERDEAEREDRAACERIEQAEAAYENNVYDWTNDR